MERLALAPAIAPMSFCYRFYGHLDYLPSSNEYLLMLTPTQKWFGYVLLIFYRRSVLKDQPHRDGTYREYLNLSRCYQDNNRANQGQGHSGKSAIYIGSDFSSLHPHKG